MSTATSPGTGRVYGVERVVLSVARSSFYADQHKRAAGDTKPCAGRRGPKPTKVM